MKNKNKILSFLYNYRKIKSINLFVENSLFLLINIIILFIVFITGFMINNKSDSYLISLRKNKDNGYVIPKEGLFQYATNALEYL